MNVDFPYEKLLQDYSKFFFFTWNAMQFIVMYIFFGNVVPIWLMKSDVWFVKKEKEKKKSLDWKKTTSCSNLAPQMFDGKWKESCFFLVGGGVVVEIDVSQKAMQTIKMMCMQVEGSS